MFDCGMSVVLIKNDDDDDGSDGSDGQFPNRISWNQIESTIFGV